MNKMVYNISILVGLGLIGTGVAMVSVPAALVVVGALILVLTITGARIAGQA